jgi:hypothetical protein
MAIGPAPMCVSCKHFKQDEPGRICAAFPNGIPNRIWENKADHRKPYPGDYGIQFELESGSDKEIIEAEFKRLFS